MNNSLELQRYGRNKSTMVDYTYISSGAYRKKFDLITNDKKINRILYTKAKKMLFHRSGTKYEDMYWFDSLTGTILASELNASEEEQIQYSESIQSAISGKNNIITMHTHPCSMPPSIADFNSVNIHNYSLGIILCHNGKIFCYKSAENVSMILYNLYVTDFIKLGNDEYHSQLLALNELQKIYDISYWEVNVNG